MAERSKHSPPEATRLSHDPIVRGEGRMRTQFGEGRVGPTTRGVGLLDEVDSAFWSRHWRY